MTCGRSRPAGLLLDRVGSSLRNASLIQMAACAVALLASMLAFTLTSNLAGFIPVFSLALLGLFVTSAPLCARPPARRALVPCAGETATVHASPGAWRARSVRLRRPRPPLGALGRLALARLV